MRRRTAPQPGFTLIEIAVVLVLMALLAAVVSVSARGMVGGVTRDEVVGQLRSLDSQARRHADRTGHGVVLTVDSASRLLSLSDPDDRGSSALGRYQFPAGFQIDHAWRLRRGQADAGEHFTLAYRRGGGCPTWGLTVVDPNGKRDALLIAGPTGQLTTWETDAQVRDILAQLRRRNAD